MARFGAFSACRESFVPLWLAQHRAGRILYRMRGGDGARQHNNTPGTTGVKAPEGPEGLEGAEGSGGPEDLAAVPGAAGPGRSTPRVTAITTPAKVAHNFRRSFFETAQKRCNSNGVISMFEQVARGLRAKLMRERPVGPQAASRRWACPLSARSAAAQWPGRATTSDILQERLTVRAVPDGDGLGDGPQGVGHHGLEAAVGHELLDFGQ